MSASNGYWRPMTPDDIGVLLTAHREEYLKSCQEFLGMSNAEAAEALRDFEAGVFAGRNTPASERGSL